MVGDVGQADHLGNARPQLARLLDLLATEDAIEARRERLRDRGGRAQNVDDDPDRRVVTLELADPVDEQLVSRISDMEDVIAVRWRR